MSFNPNCLLSLFCPGLKHDLCSPVRGNLTPKHVVFWSTGRLIYESDIKILYDVREDGFDLVRSEKASWAGVPPGTPVQRLGSGCCKLVLVRIFFLGGTHIGEAEA